MNADRLEALRQGAATEPAPFNVIAMDNVARLAIEYARQLENGGGQVIPLHRNEAPAPVTRPGA